ncbi:sugar phosphate nucleotidyltransferase, partial [Pseudomonas aeruginosa]|uniref:sugar phosphate nucleotidyltransferase n=1 Tax=Pseudomonas aeruginosa TaxID=287 RepID=UPI0031B70EA8
NCPKPLLKVGEKPILEIILERFIGAGFHRFFISTHYMPEMIREHFADGSRWGVSIRYVHEETHLGQVGHWVYYPIMR